MSDNTALRALTEQMAREGIRRLLIISGGELVSGAGVSATRHITQRLVVGRGECPC